MPSAGFEPVIPTGERLQTHVLDRSTTGIGSQETLQNFMEHEVSLLCLEDPANCPSTQ
jgi:hypothetical protein